MFWPAAVVPFVQMAADAAHVALGEFIFRQNGAGNGQQASLLIGGGLQSGPELVEAWAAGRGQHGWQRVNVGLRAGHALAPREHQGCSSEGLGDSHIHRPML